MRVPTLSYVVHKCHIEAARLLYRNPDMIDSMVPVSRQMENRRKLDAILLEGIRRAVSSFVPTVALLKKQSKQIEE